LLYGVTLARPATVTPTLAGRCWTTIQVPTAIAAAGNQLFELHNDGKIWRYSGNPCGNFCPSWQMLDNNPSAVGIASGGTELYQLHNDGSIWRYTGTPCGGISCPGWDRLDNNTGIREIVATGDCLYQRAPGRLDLAIHSTFLSR